MIPTHYVIFQSVSFQHMLRCDFYNQKAANAAAKAWVKETGHYAFICETGAVQ